MAEIKKMGYCVTVSGKSQRQRNTWMLQIPVQVR